VRGALLWIVAVWCVAALVFGVAWAFVMSRHGWDRGPDDEEDR
jgi:hypothetical protein